MVSEPADSIDTARLPATRLQLRGVAWLAALLAGPLVLAAAWLRPGLNQPMLHNPAGHLLIALAGALIGVALALLVLHVARRAHDGRVFLVGMGFLSTASILVTHAVATPGALLGGRELATAFSALFGLVLGSVFFALSGLPLAAGANTLLMRRARLIVLALFCFIAVYNWLLLLLIPSFGAATAPATHSSAQHAPGAVLPAVALAAVPIAGALTQLRGWLVGAGLALWASAALRHYQLYRRSPSRFGLALCCGAALFGEALLTQYYAQAYSLLFWVYHAQEFLAFGAVGYAVLAGYRSGLSRESVLESLLLAGSRARLQAEYIGAMDALIDALAHGDRPDPALRGALRERVGLTDSQVQVFERAALAVAQERRQRHELERLNSTLRQVEAHKSQLTQMVVHDLKNPLTALISFLDVLNMSQLSPAQHDLLEGALRSSQNLSGLIGDMLDVTRIEEGQLELELSWFVAHDLLHDCVGALRSWLEQEGKSAEIRAPAEAVLIHGDLRLLRRVVLNLLSNAIKHTPPGTHILLSAAAVAGGAGVGVAIEVADDGPGIPPERMERIFQRFGSFASRPSARQSSTGLGLTFCRLVAEAHGGSVGVESSLGAGATFRVLLPCAQQ